MKKVDTVVVGRNYLTYSTDESSTIIIIGTAIYDNGYLLSNIRIYGINYNHSIDDNYKVIQAYEGNESLYPVDNNTTLYQLTHDEYLLYFIADTI